MKRALIYLGIAAFAAIVVIALESPFQPRLGVKGVEYFISGYDSKTVAVLKISQLLDSVELKREGDGWLVSETITPLKKELFEKEGRDIPAVSWTPADNNRVRAALSVFGGLESGVLVSKNPDKQRPYHTGPDGLHVAAFDSNGKNVFDVVIGKGGPDFISTYIRRSENNNVYLVAKALTGIFSPRASDWMKKEEKASQGQEEAKSQKE